MSTAAIVLAALLGFACIVVVAWPYLRSDKVDNTLDQLNAVELEQLALLESRDRALAALQELEIDHREGKIAEADYRDLVSELRAEAAELIAAVDAVGETQAEEPAPHEGAAQPEDGTG